MRNKKAVSVVVVALLLLSLITLLSAPVSAQGEEIYSTDETGTRRNQFLENHLVYFDVFADSDTEYRIRLRDEDEAIVDQRIITTDGQGNFISSDHGVFLSHDGIGEYQLELNDPDAGETLDTHDILVYDEQDFTKESSIMTYDSDGDRRDNFDESEWVYFEARIRDQYGHPPEDEFPFPPNFVNIYVQKDGEDRERIGQYDLDEDGDVEGEFRAWQRDGPGDYTLTVYDQEDEEEYARHTFTIIGIDIDIEDEYTQGQEMEIRIESNFEQDVDIKIENHTGDVIEEWTDQKFETELWIKEYTIPDDLPDGTDEGDDPYYVVVYSTDDEELARRNFDLKKYSLDATTDQGAYLPGETVEVHYTVERLVNGEEERGLEVEYRITYEDEDEEDIVGDSRTVPYGHFEFEVPRDIKVGTELDIDLWANDTEQDHPNHWDGSIHVGELRVEVDTDEDEYLPGQTVYVTADTYVSGDGSPVEGANVTVRLTHEGEREDWSESFALTDDSGQVVETIHLRTDLSAGLYDVNVTAEKFDMDDASEERIEIKEEIKTLDVLLDRDKYSYAPGETVNVSYEVTQQGEVVDANVKYEVFTERNDRVERVYEKGFATDGSIEFDVPENFNQERNLTIEVDAKIDQETTGSALMRIPVSELDLLLNADQTEYEGGETINFEYELVGDGVSESEFYKVLDDNNDIMEMDELEEYEFEFEIPEHPASSYDVVVEVVTSGGVRIEESIELRRVSRIQLEMSIETSSSYTTDVFEPGDEIEVRYKIRALGDAKIPDKITLWYSFLGTGQEDERIQTDSPEGTFKVEIPDEVSDGTYYLQVSSEETTAVNMEPVSVEEDPSVWGLRVIGSLSLLGLLAIILLLIILGIGYYTLSSPGTGIGFSKISAIFKNDEEEGEEEETPLEPDEKAPESEKEELSPAEEAHAWKGPEEKESGQVEEPEKGPEDSDQIEPDDDL